MQQKTIVSTIQKLISFKTVTGLDAQDEVLKLYDWFEENISRTDYQVRKFEDGGFHSVIIEPDIPRSGTTVVLLAHIDVVPAPSEMFNAKEKNGKLYGRGVSDMKFAAGIFLELLNNSPAFDSKNIKIVLTSDEEFGGFHGVKALLEAGELKADVVILPDGGDDFKIVQAAKGFIHIAVSSKGKSAHGSRPWEGINALQILLDGYTKLAQEFNDFSNGFWTNTLNLGKVSGGEVANMIPNEGLFQMDIRYIETSSHKEMINKTKAAFGKKCEYTIATFGDTFSLNTTNALVKKMIVLVEKYSGKKIEFSRDHGGSDARFFTKYKTPVILVKPNAGAHHTTKEWIEISSLVKYSNMLDEYLREI